MSKEFISWLKMVVYMRICSNTGWKILFIGHWMTVHGGTWWFHLNDKLIVLLIKTNTQYLYVIPTCMDLIQQEASEVIIQNCSIQERLILNIRLANKSLFWGPSCSATRLWRCSPRGLEGESEIIIRSFIVMQISNALTQVYIPQI